MNKMINSFLQFVPTENWITTCSGLPWLKLNLDVPTEAILQEANSLYAHAVLHRDSDRFAQYSNQGWRSLSLYGENATTTTHTNGVKNWTHIADLCPDTVNFIKKYWDVDATSGRIRYMWLDPQGYILPHHDREQPLLFETNVAISHPEGCQFRFLDYGTVPFTAGSSFLVDISNRHMVMNDSDQIRTHIIVHARLKPGIIKSSYEQNFYH